MAWLPEHMSLHRLHTIIIFRLTNGYNIVNIVIVIDIILVLVLVFVEFLLIYLPNILNK